jgi:ankyrin repeat protein
VLCAKRNPDNPGQILAQIHAVVQRLKSHPDNTVKQTVFRLNNNQISAFEISAITNNSIVACYLAEVMYDISQDTQSALRVLNCKDTQGNTILHLLARKGTPTSTP